MENYHLGGDAKELESSLQKAYSTSISYEFYHIHVGVFVRISVLILSQCRVLKSGNGFGTALNRLFLLHL